MKSGSCSRRWCLTSTRTATLLTKKKAAGQRRPEERNTLDRSGTPGSAFKYSGSELDALAEAKNYYSWIAGRFAPYMGSHITEVGAGIGTFSEYILRVPKVRELVAIEPAENTFPALRARYADDPRVTPLKGYLSEHYPSLTTDSVVAVNVLEHVKDDRGFLEEARACVVKGGSLLLFVPALPAIFGSLDRAFEHHRRYTKRTLSDTIESAGWKLVEAKYMNFPGIAAWFTAGRILGKTSIAARDARTYDRLVVPWLSRLESIVEPPIGANLLAVAKKA